MLRSYPDRSRWEYRTPSKAHASAEYHELHGSLMYAVRFPDGTIKIGHTGQIARRLTNLIKDGGGMPDVLAIKPGTMEDEAAVHEHLKPHRRHGNEWYHPHPDVLALVNQWRADLGREPVAA